MRVYAVDVGYGQLAWSLRQDPRVISIERTNIRYLAPLPEPARLATVDVSFIGLALVLPNIAKLLAPGGQIIALIKPQFEVGKGQVGKGGVVRDPKLHDSAIEQVLAAAESAGLTPAGVIRSPITGPAGNVEFLAWLKLGAEAPPAHDPACLTLRSAHVALDPARRNRLILVAALAAMVLLFLWVARSALVPYIFALAMAYILLPAVNRLEILFKRVSGGAALVLRDPPRSC